MKRTNYIVNDTAAAGVEFTGSKGHYFWVPDDDRLYQWVGSGWCQIPIDNLGVKRRETLLRIWHGPCAATKTNP